MAAKKEDLLKQEAISGLLSTVINLEITKIPQVERTILNGLLVEGKTFKEVLETTKLTASRQTVVFQNGVNRLINNLGGLSKKLQSFDKLAGELYQTQQLLKKFENEDKLASALTWKQKKFLSLALTEIGLSARAVNVCDWGQIHTVSDLVKLSKTEFLKLRNCGKKTVDEVDAFFLKNHLSWKMKI
jgi:hypothetical protein